MVEIHRCSKCKNEYPHTTEFFAKNGNRLHSWCKKCLNAYKVQYRQKHLKEAREKERRYKQEHPVNRKEIDRRYYYNNRQRILERASSFQYKEKRRKWYQDHREESIARVKQWKNNNRIRARAIKHRRRMRQYESGGSYTDKDIELQLQSQKRLCWWCQMPITGLYHIDHRIPVSKGGSNDATNLVISCPHCNLSKSNKMPWEFCGRLL